MLDSRLVFVVCDLSPVITLFTPSELPAQSQAIAELHVTAFCRSQHMVGLEAGEDAQNKNKGHRRQSLPKSCSPCEVLLFILTAWDIRTAERRLLLGLPAPVDIGCKSYMVICRSNLHEISGRCEDPRQRAGTLR